MDAPAPSPELIASMPPDELRAHMRKLGYRTQSDLAAAIGVSRSAVCFPHRVESLDLFGEIPDVGPLGLEVRFAGFPTGPALPTFDIQLTGPDGAVLVAVGVAFASWAWLSGIGPLATIAMSSVTISED